MKNNAATIIMVRRPNRSESRPASAAPAAQPSSMEATLNPVPTLSELNAVRSPSTVPLMTPLSKPNRNPPIVATQLISKTKPKSPSAFAGAVAAWAVEDCDKVRLPLRQVRFLAFFADLVSPPEVLC